MSKAEAYMVQTLKYGPRLVPMTTAEAEEMVKKKQAKLLKAGNPGFYDGTKRGNMPKTATRKLETKTTAPTTRSPKSPPAKDEPPVPDQGESKED